MKCDIPAPLERLAWFSQRFSLEAEEQEALSRFRDVLVEKKTEFSERFYEYFHRITETRLFLEHEKREGSLKKAWSGWFEAVLTEGFTDRLLNYLWRSGLRHVEVNIDKRFINLGYSIVRRFFQETVRERIPPGDRKTVIVALDKIIDFCLLIETYAYIAATSQCDMEVVRGISHQIRNPLTVIGGSLMRLLRKEPPESPLHKTYEAMLSESRRLEGMVADAAVYSEMYERAPEFSEIFLEELISGAFEKLKAKKGVEKVRIETAMDPEHRYIKGVFQDLETMFFYLLENSLEAVDPEKPYIAVSSILSVLNPSFLEVEIFNNGTPPGQDDMDNLFVPFYSSKPMGTGFGLPIAELAARKSLGELHLEPLPGKGTRVTVKLPVSWPGK